jgi:putative transcriptional regulator
LALQNRRQKRQTVMVLIGTPPTKGRLLVATPPLEDPNFDRSVVYVLEHHSGGALGVVVNRPTTEPLDRPLDRWSDLLAHPAAIFAGGPVETDALVGLAHAPGLPQGTVTSQSDREDDHGLFNPVAKEPGSEDPVGEAESADDALARVIGEVMSVDLSVDPLLITDRVKTVRIFRGYAGWGPGQLESEIEAGSWLVLDAFPEDIFSEVPQDVWRLVLRRQPGRLAWLANAPDDLSAN